MPARNPPTTRIHLLTLAYDASLAAIDSRPLDRFLADKELLALREHFFIVHGQPHLCCVLTYRLSIADAPPPPSPPPPPAPPPPFAAARTHRRDDRIDLDEPQRARFVRLRGWRAQRARRDGVPAYVVFTNRELAALACSAPTTPGQLLAFPGCGEGKVARYGDELLALLAPERTTDPTAPAAAPEPAP
ncbi:MAG: HRDC domain-containing protein [Planctomycetes bacterium]|jgi:hypothetical protein|nr:HRDC domain-containing protein [Planctomycetota bacterium]